MNNKNECQQSSLSLGKLTSPSVRTQNRFSIKQQLNLNLLKINNKSIIFSTNVITVAMATNVVTVTMATNEETTK